jgi:hypothetical protein
MLAPPSLVGGVNETLAEASPPVAVTAVGGCGATAVGVNETPEEGGPGPTAFVA